MARGRRIVLLAGLLAAIAGAAAYPSLRAQLTGLDWEADGSASARVGALIGQHFPAHGAEQDVIVFQAPRHNLAAMRDVVDRVVTAAGSCAGVSGVTGPFDAAAAQQISSDGRVGYALVGLTGDPAQRAATAARLQSTVAGAAGNGPVQAQVTGLSPIFNDEISVEERGAMRGELLGVLLALIVLVVALGAVVAAVVPLVVTLTSLLITFGVLAVAALAVSFDSFIMSSVTMIGTGIAIDYSLFVVTRFREQLAVQLRRGVSPREATEQAVGTAVATSGRTIVIAGTVVAVSMCSLFVIGAPIYRELAIAIAIGSAVACTLLSALTVLPALLAALGPRVNRASLPDRWQPADARIDDLAHDSGWVRWARGVMKHPVAAGTVALVVLLLAAWPLGGLRHGLDLGMAALRDTPSGQASAALSRSFGPGAIAPVQIFASGPANQPIDEPGLQKTTQLISALRADPGAAGVDVDRSGGYLLITAVPEAPIDSPATTALVERIRGEADALSRGGEVQILVGGATAKFIDLGHVTRADTPAVLALVLGASFVFLLIVFRSIALALKAVVMNLLTTAAAVGLTVAVFQWGWWSWMLNFTSVGYLQVYMPVTIFAVVFGLSMDYQVFLIRRVREEWLRSGDNTQAVTLGIAHTARPITAAATIMVCVFASFIASDVLEMKELGFGLAVAIAIDAALVRLVLVPALMRLLGQWNWWLPESVDRILPSPAVD
ncbi:MMPL family transporter [Mycobacterium shigaense]|uniref:MMPL family transporter n=1 Tax=Mycobacterium shigaense TaxID=722731 RepID=UPI0013C35CDA|nr:efflux RND transporter permease subunit [Mycobacterium shigaense]